MTIAALLSGALLALGCESSNEAPSDPAPSEVADTADTETSVEPEGSQEAMAEPSESESADDEAARRAALVERVKGLTQIKGVVHGDEGIRLVYVLEGNPKVNQDSKPKVVTDAMLFAEFFTASLLYPRLRELDGLEQTFVFKGERIGTIRTTRESFESLGYASAMQGATDDESKQRVFRKLLERLPPGEVEIDKKYRP
jgi:hypothetical protein